VVLITAQPLSLRDPVWPGDFKWVYAGPQPGQHCVQIKEPSDKHTWADNYFCQKIGKGISNIGMRWSNAGKYIVIRVIFSF